MTKLTLLPLGAAAEKPSPKKARAKNAKRTATGSDGWVPLFNGKDLTGWYEPEQNKGTWQMVDGALVGRGGGAGAGAQPAVLASVPAKNVPLAQIPYIVETHVAGRKITSFVNGRKTAEYVDLENKYRAGQIRIVCSAAAEFDFRRIEIKEERLQSPVGR